MTDKGLTTYDEVNKIWYGRKTEAQYGPEDSLGSEVLKALKKDPDHIVQICYPSNKEYTNKEILKLSINAAESFKKLEMQQCEIVGICAVNSDYLAPLVYGSWFRGLAISTIDPYFDKDEIKHMCSITKPNIMFCDSEVYLKVKEALVECGLNATTIYTVLGDIEGVPNITDFLKDTAVEEDFKCEPLKMGIYQLAAVTCSSGTSGLSKGVCVSHGGVLNFLKFPTGYRLFGFSSLFWSSSLLTLIGSAICGATKIITHLPFSPEVFFEIAQRHKMTFLMGTPSQLGLIVASPKFQQYDLSSLKHALFVGSALPYTFVKKWKEHLPSTDILVYYGLSETCSGVSSGLASEDGNNGQLRPNIEVKIIDDNGHNLGPNETGEIYARYFFPWLGYYGNPESTAEIYDSEGWIHSGDLGYLNNDGNLYIIDRKKDILKYNNYHFSPTEIEKIILELKEVVEVCVFGTPDLIYNYLPSAAVVKVPGSTLTENDVCQHVAERMAHFKHLRGGVYFVDELPKTNSGKIVRRKVTVLCIKSY